MISCAEEGFRNGQMRALSAVLAEPANAEATSADRRRHTGRALRPAEGISLAVKDKIETVPAAWEMPVQWLAASNQLVKATGERKFRSFRRLNGLLETRVDHAALDARGGNVRTPQAEGGAAS